MECRGIPDILIHLSNVDINIDYEFLESIMCDPKDATDFIFCGSRKIYYNWKMRTCGVLKEYCDDHFYHGCKYQCDKTLNPKEQVCSECGKPLALYTFKVYWETIYTDFNGKKFRFKDDNPQGIYCSHCSLTHGADAPFLSKYNILKLDRNYKESYSDFCKREHQKLLLERNKRAVAWWEEQRDNNTDIYKELTAKAGYDTDDSIDID